MSDSVAVRAFIHHERLRGLAPSTIEKRLSVLRRAERAVGEPLIGATTEQLYSWLDRPLAANSRYALISHLAAFYRWAVINGHAPSDPTLKLARPRLHPGIPRPIDDEDLQLGLACADVDVHAMMSLAALCGLRCAEVAALHVEHLHRQRDETGAETTVALIHGKGNKQRIVPIHPDALASLKRHGLPRRGPIFRTADGRQRPAHWVSHRIREHLVKLDIGASAHRLRHWFGTHVYEESGYDLRMTQELLGHSSPNTTALYTKWARSRASSVVAKLNVTGPAA